MPARYDRKAISVASGPTAADEITGRCSRQRQQSSCNSDDVAVHQKYRVPLLSQRMRSFRHCTAPAVVQPDSAPCRVPEQIWPASHPRFRHGNCLFAKLHCRPSLPHCGRFSSLSKQLDGPPPGGFPMIKYKRNLPKGGPSSVVVAMGIVSMSLFGYYKIIQANNERGCAPEFYCLRAYVFIFPFWRSQTMHVYSFYRVGFAGRITGRTWISACPLLPSWMPKQAFSKRSPCTRRTSPSVSGPPNSRQQTLFCSQDCTRKQLLVCALSATCRKVYVMERMKAKEADLMSEVPGWKGDNIYKTRSYMEPMRILGQIPKDLF
eukprot:3673651-Pleurochrysis_carterae.AAC.2